MHRLVAYAPNGVQRFNVDRDVMLIGSGADCDIRLTFAGVGPEHARLQTTDGQLVIEDLGTRKGIWVNGERVKQSELQVLDEIRLGSIALLLEDVLPEPVSAEPPSEENTDEPTITPESMLEHLARVSQWVLSDSASSVTLESLVTDLLGELGGGVLFLFQGEPEHRGIKLVVATRAEWLGHGEDLLRQVAESERTSGDSGLDHGADAYGFSGDLDRRPAWIVCRSFSALERPHLFVIALPRFRPDAWSPVAAFRTLADQLILGLVHHVGQYEPILFGRNPQRDLTLAQGLIAGESRVMKRVLRELRGAVDLPEPILLRGEVGVSKELLARSLHLSGSRAEAPFVIAQCAGGSAAQIEADIFGAEFDGKTETMVREGKLVEAHGGTLYLEDIESLPLRLQDRLMRFLRSGEAEPVDSLRSRPVDVRLICSCMQPLESYVARDVFRLDLAYRLAQYVVEIPALRDRGEDLPLLIQAAVNRCCHQTGKRIQGITVKAMEALAKHDYPGNLQELEAIIRRLVYLCPSGRPIDDSMLPEQVRLSKIEGLRPTVSATSELNLEKLVADCERAAIREALRRSSGNKSETARQLGLSRNGLSMKITRLGLEA